MKLMKWVGASVITIAAAHVAGAATLPGPLVTAQWLKDHQNEVTVVDIRDDMKTFTAEPKFDVDKKTGKKTLVETGGHIAGAIPVEFGKIREEHTVDGVKIKAPQKAVGRLSRPLTVDLKTQVIVRPKVAGFSIVD